MDRRERLSSRHPASRQGALRVGMRAAEPASALITAGDLALAGIAARDLARRGADIVLLHRPGDEAAALRLALRVEAEGRRCELLAAEPTDAAACEEGVLHAVFLGGGRIGALVCVGEADRAEWRQGVQGFAAALRAALPHLAPSARVLHLQPELPREAGEEAQAARRALQRSARGLIGWLRRQHGLRGQALVSGARCGTARDWPEPGWVPASG